MAFVLDASVALAWHFDDEFDARAEAANFRSDDETMWIPGHWFAEVANGLLAGERASRTDLSRIGRFMKRLSVATLEIDGLEGGAVFDRVMPLARAHKLTIYDAQYLELSERRGLSLATLDRRLADAARSVGVEIVGDEK